MLFLYYSFKSPSFQTWITNQIGTYFSNKWGTTVKVDGVDIEFWKKAVLNGVYVEDQHKDTLLYAEELKLDISLFDFDSQRVSFDNVIIKNTIVKLRHFQKDSVFNLQFIVDEFASKNVADTNQLNWGVNLSSISLINVSFSYLNENDTSKTSGINYSNIYAKNINGQISNLSFSEDTTYFNLHDFSLIEKSGFILKKLSANASISPVLLSLTDLNLETNKSILAADLVFKYKDYTDFNEFIDKVKMKIQFKNSDIEMADVAFFSTELYGIHKKIFIDGNVSGNVNNLNGRNLMLNIGDETSFKGNIDISGLPDIDQTFMLFEAKDFRTSKKGIESIPLPPFDKPNFISLPDNLSLFGVIKYKGNFTGFYNDFVSFGKFSTDLGFISTDISLRSDSASGLPIYHGKFACTNFELGKFFEVEEQVGKVSLNVQVDGKGFKKTDAIATVEGQVSHFSFMQYDYQNIDLKGKLSKNIFDGHMLVNDENLDLDFNGNIDFSHSPTKLNFVADLSKANLSALNFVKSDDLVGVSGNIEVNAIGNNIDDVVGNMNFNNVIYTKGRSKYDFKSIELVIKDTAGIKNMELKSHMLDAHLYGKFLPKNIGTSINDFFSNYIPAYITSINNKKNIISNPLLKNVEEFSFDVVFKNTDIVTSAFFPSLKIKCPASLKGNYDEKNNILSFNSDFPLISFNESKFSKCTFSANTKDNYFWIDAYCQRLSLSDSVWIDSVSVVSSVARDTASFNISWHNGTQLQHKGDVPGYIAFFNQPESGGSKVKVKLLPTEITIADSTWNLTEENEVLIDSSLIKIQNINFVCGKQRVKLDGNISNVKEDHFYLMLTSFSLANLNTYLRGTDLSFYGTVSGNTSISSLHSKPMFGSSLDIKDFRINKELIGDGSIVSIYDSKKDVVSFNSSFKRGGGENLSISGNYFPSEKINSLDVTASIRDFRLDFFEPFIKENFENLKGLASLDIKVKGNLVSPMINGTVNAKVDNVHVNYLGTDYKFEGEVKIEPNSFDFGSLTILDVNNNKADVISGKIFHTNYKDFQMDIDLSLAKFLCLNTNQVDNSIYYGKVFATGIVNVFGFLDHLNLSASVKTDKAKNVFGKLEYSQLSIPLSGSEEVGENGFISFVKHDTAQIQPKYKVNTPGFTMDFKLEATSDAQVQLIFDEKVGDVIRANGTGDIRMLIDEYGDFKMFGDYTVVEGDYLFTLKNVVNKKFRLEKGGTINWSGSPENADIHMKAIYELRTSLTPLFLSHEQTDAIRKRYPVDCIMNLNGKLLEPDIAFDIYMPTVDDFTRQQAYDKFRGSESETNKQVFSLMFTNSFSPPSGQVQNESSGGPGAGTVTSTEMLSNQLSNWLSQISNEFDVGVHYRLGDEVNKDQVQLALSTQLFNDKMSIDGSVANSSNTNTQNTASVVGDINVDYKLTEDGKFRAKAYNRANEGDILNTQKGPYTQGVGVFYREEFETIGELYRRYLRKIKKIKK